MKPGSLLIVGSGIGVAGRMSLEARSAARRAEKLYYLVAEPAAERWLRRLNPTAASLAGCYAEGRPRISAYEKMVEAMLAPAREGARVCGVFYRHPGVLAYPSHEAIRRARASGLRARMLPAVSAADCLYADLAIDPGAVGMQSFEATEFMVHGRRPDTTAYLLLWQADVVGELRYIRGGVGRDRLTALAARLQQFYGPSHGVVLYEAPQYPICPPVIVWTTIGEIPNHHPMGLVLVPPAGPPGFDAEAAALPGLAFPRADAPPPAARGGIAAQAEGRGGGRFAEHS